MQEKYSKNRVNDAFTEDEKISNSQIRDSSAKWIFGDPILCAQFLDGYVDIPMLKNIKPEDIEDVSNRYVHMFTEERNSDVVKRIHVRDENGQELPFFLISLIEHKNQVDYNVTMQILRYMVYIWEEYEKEMEKKHPGISRTKGFRYPPILPVIFYDGVKNWTAATQLKDRIFLSDTLLKYIPDFDCILVQLRDYSNAELMKRKNELSFVMMFEKLQSAYDFNELEAEVDATYIQEALEYSPVYLIGVIAHMAEIFLAKLNVPQEEIDVFVGQIKERNMAELFANFKAYDVQATRAEARKEGHADGVIDGQKQEREEGIKKLVKSAKELGANKEQAIQQLMKQYELSDSDALEKVKQYWN